MTESVSSSSEDDEGDEYEEDEEDEDDDQEESQHENTASMAHSGNQQSSYRSPLLAAVRAVSDSEHYHHDGLRLFFFLIGSYERSFFSLKR